MTRSVKPLAAVTVPHCPPARGRVACRVADVVVGAGLLARGVVVSARSGSGGSFGDVAEVVLTGDDATDA
ncbi:MAG: hypothetical protein GEU86_04475 [Actinophytocola sp.]|nr:hypothetical protein [Actinophytocola sp.]